MRNKTILWADDDADDLQLMRQIVLDIDQQYQFIEVNNGREAIDYLAKSMVEENLPDLLVLDINMPILDGRETITILKNDEAYINLPVVVFTTSSSKLDMLFCNKYKVDMVTKPTSIEELKDAIVQLLAYSK